MWPSNLSKIKTIATRILKNRWIFRLVGIGLFVLILMRLDLEKAWQTLLAIDLGFLILSLLIQAIVTILSALRWQYICIQFQISIPFRRMLFYQLIGTAAALVTPGQLGEFVKVLYQRQEGYAIPRSTLTVLIDRALDVITLFLFGFLALAILFGLPPNLAVGLVVGVSLVLLVGFFFLRNKETSAQWIATTLAKVSPKAYQNKMERESYQLALEISGLHPRFLIVISGMTFLVYVLLLFRVLALVYALHLDVPFWYFIMIVPLLRLVGLIPISVLGIGTRDITAIYLLGEVGISAEAAVLFSILGLVTFQIQALAGLFAWWQYPLKFGDGRGRDLPDQSLKETKQIIPQNPSD